jgi:hypothetical protein
MKSAANELQGSLEKKSTDGAYLKMMEGFWATIDFTPFFFLALASDTLGNTQASTSEQLCITGPW